MAVTEYRYLDRVPKGLAGYGYCRGRMQPDFVLSTSGKRDCNARTWYGASRKCIGFQ